MTRRVVVYGILVYVIYALARVHVRMTYTNPSSVVYSPCIYLSITQWRAFYLDTLHCERRARSQRAAEDPWPDQRQGLFLPGPRHSLPG